MKISITGSLPQQPPSVPQQDLQSSSSPPLLIREQDQNIYPLRGKKPKKKGANKLLQQSVGLFCVEAKHNPQSSKSYLKHALLL